MYLYNFLLKIIRQINPQNMSSSAIQPRTKTVDMRLSVTSGSPEVAFVVTLGLVVVLSVVGFFVVCADITKLKARGHQPRQQQSGAFPANP
jgi:hypothetical protein